LNKNTKVHCLFYSSTDMGHAGTKDGQQFISAYFQATAPYLAMQS
jgi:hypothetical protein